MDGVSWLGRHNQMHLGILRAKKLIAMQQLALVSERSSHDVLERRISE
jgi:hypothetical protein